MSDAPSYTEGGSGQLNGWPDLFCWRPAVYDWDNEQ